MVLFLTRSENSSRRTTTTSGMKKSKQQQFDAVETSSSVDEKAHDHPRIPRMCKLRRNFSCREPQKMARTGIDVEKSKLEPKNVIQSFPEAQACDRNRKISGDSQATHVLLSSPFKNFGKFASFFNNKEKTKYINSLNTADTDRTVVVGDPSMTSAISAHRSLPRHKETSLVLPPYDDLQFSACLATFRQPSICCGSGSTTSSSAVSRDDSSIFMHYYHHHNTNNNGSSSSSSSIRNGRRDNFHYLNHSGSGNCGGYGYGSSSNKSSGYELSSDFEQKQIEVLERKYGGKDKAQRAAYTVQRAYRRYAMTKQFQACLRDKKSRRSIAAVSGAAFFGEKIGGGVFNIRKQPEEEQNQIAQFCESKPSLHSMCTGNAMDKKVLVTPSLTNQLKVDRRPPQQQLSEAKDQSQNANVPKISSVMQIKLNEHGSVVTSADPQNQSSDDYGFVTNRRGEGVPTAPFGVISNSPSKSTITNGARKRSVSMEHGHHHSIKAAIGGAQMRIDQCDQQQSATARNHTATFKILSDQSEILNDNMVHDDCLLERPLHNSGFYCRKISEPQKTRCSTRNTATTGPINPDYQNLNICHQARTILPTNAKMSGQIFKSSIDSGSNDFSLSTSPAVTCASLVNNSNISKTTGQGHAIMYGSVDGSPKKTLIRYHATGNLGVTIGPRIPITSVVSTSRIQSSSTAVPAAPVWVPRSDSGQRTQIKKSPSLSGGDKFLDDQQKSQYSKDSPPRAVVGVNNDVIAAYEPSPPRLFGHWGRRSLVNSSARTHDVERKRQYRISLNFFNKKPERGVQFLIKWNFVEPNPSGIAKFLLTRKGLSRQMIGEYLGNLQNPFNMAVLYCFAAEVNFCNMEIDTALRHFQSLFRLPGEAQKIERIVEVFARRYCECNAETVARHFKQPDTIFILSFAIIMLNTDLHSPNLKAEKRMKVEDFIRNLRGIDGNSDIDPKFLTDLYNRIKEQEFKAGADHVTQVLKVERSIVGKKPTLALNYRRLVCYCRLYEIIDRNKKQSAAAHQREVFLFNDMLLITKIFSRKKNNVLYNYRESHCLVGLKVETFRNHHYTYGLRISFILDNRVLYFNARNEEDRSKFMEDLQESVMESDEMEALRIELELEKQNGCYVASMPINTANVITTTAAAYRSHFPSGATNRLEQQRDSGVSDVIEQEDHPHLIGPADIFPPIIASADHVTSPASSNSLSDMISAATSAAVPVSQSKSSTSTISGRKQQRASETEPPPRRRRFSGTSLDSGMSSTASVASREPSPPHTRHTHRLSNGTVISQSNNSGNKNNCQNSVSPSSASDSIQVVSFSNTNKFDNNNLLPTTSHTAANE